MAAVEIESSALESIVDFIDKAVPVIKKAEAQEAAVSAAIPETVDALIKAGFLAQNGRETAIASLADPATALESLRKIAASRTKAASTTEAAPAAIGKSASAAPSVADAKESAGDEFLRRFGL